MRLVKRARTEWCRALNGRATHLYKSGADVGDAKGLEDLSGCRIEEKPCERTALYGYATTSDTTWPEKRNRAHIGNMPDQDRVEQDLDVVLIVDEQADREDREERISDAPWS